MWINIKEKIPKKYEPVLTYARGYGFEIQYLECSMKVTDE